MREANAEQQDSTNLYLPGIERDQRSLNEQQFCQARTDDAVIVGLGIDIAEIDRVEAAIRRHGQGFLKRVFTPAEISYCERHKMKFERYAARFAAKEAAMKALGTGWRKGVRWRDIEVENQPGGKPMISFAGAAGEHAARLGATHNSLSITHSGNLAFAQVILES